MEFVPMQVTRQDSLFADAVAALLTAHPSRAFSVVTADGKQERGYGPVTVGKDFLQCRAGADERQGERIYLLSGIISITPA
jgi:hypothetical protein